MSKSNYKNDYKPYDDVPIKTSHRTRTQANTSAGGTSQRVGTQPEQRPGLSAAQRFALEKEREEARRNAYEAARKAGVTNLPATRRTNLPVPAKRNANAVSHAGNTHSANSYRTTAQHRGVSDLLGRIKLPQITLSLTTFLAVLALVLVIFSFSAFGRIEQNYIPEVNRVSVMDDLIKQMETPLKEGYTKKDIGSENMYAGSLALVNSANKFVFNNTPDFVPTEELVVINSVKASKSYKVKDYTVKLNKSTVAVLDKMFDAFFTETGKNDVMITAGYRTTEEQQSIYDKKVEQLGADQKTAALPGYSEHHTGYAVDFNIYTDGGVTKQFDGTGEYAWIPNNAYKYGFVLRYPDGKTDVTGIDNEPWHYRYVGVPHAYYMASTGKTLEEYITLLRNYPCDYPLYVTDWDGTMYEVYYKKSDGASTSLPVPESGEYTVSGNNADGYIVTVKSGTVGNGTSGANTGTNTGTATPSDTNAASGNGAQSANADGSNAAG